MLLTKRAALVAAMLVLAMVFGQRLVSGPFSSQKALTKALDNVQHMQTATMNVTCFRGDNEVRGKGYLQNPAVMRHEMISDGAKTIVLADISSGKNVTLLEDLAFAVVDRQTVNFYDLYVPFQILDLFNCYGNTSAVTVVETTEGGEAALLYAQRLGGEQGQSRREFRMWLSKRTLLPVRMSMTTYANSTRLYGFEYTDIAWNVPLRASLFRMEVPAGYSTTQLTGPDGELEDVSTLPTEEAIGPQRLWPMGRPRLPVLAEAAAS